MNNHKKRIAKPASKDPVKEAIGHPDGPGLEEMLSGREEEKLKKGTYKRIKPDEPNIPVI